MEKGSCFYDVQRNGQDMKITLKGDMDHHNAVSVRGEIDAILLEERPKRVVINLHDIGFMDSSGLGFIMGRYSVMQKLGGDLVLEEPNERITKIFDLAGLGRIVRIENGKKEEIK